LCGREGSREPTDDRVGSLAAQEALVLALLGAGQQVDIDCRRAKCHTDPPNERRTASRNAALAFSIGCQRSATCLALD
jgi:hypothetical protein